MTLQCPREDEMNLRTGTLFYSLFQSVTTKRGRISRNGCESINKSYSLLMGLLMFIVASPSSVGGGRTIAFPLNILIVYHFARGEKTISLFGRERYTEDTMKVMAVTMLGTILCFGSIMILSITEPFSLMEIVFEICSAFGATGLSLGITHELSTVGKTNKNECSGKLNPNRNAFPYWRWTTPFKRLKRGTFSEK